MNKIMVLGSNGFIGKEICRVLEQNAQNSVIKITRENYAQLLGSECDIFVNANGNSRKYWANQNPILDFEASTFSVYRSIFDFKYDAYVYISSIDAKFYDSAYGFNKHLSEEIIKQYCPQAAILHCSSVIGKNMKKGVIFDIHSGDPVFLTPDSSLSFITNTAVAEIVQRIIDHKFYNLTLQVSASTLLTVEEVGKVLGQEVKYGELLEKQVYSSTDLITSSLRNIYPELKDSREYISEVFDAN